MPLSSVSAQLLALMSSFWAPTPTKRSRRYIIARDSQLWLEYQSSHARFTTWRFASPKRSRIGLQSEVSCSSPLKARALKSSESSSFPIFFFPAPFPLPKFPLFAHSTLADRRDSKIMRNEPGSETTGRAGTNSESRTRVDLYGGYWVR